MSEQNPYLVRNGDDLDITEAGYAELEKMVTDTRGQVYAFNGSLSPVIVAAAMARLSRRAGDMRVAILDEFMLSDGQKADELIERVVTGFGDDSVQQLSGIQFVVEDASNLLTKLLEWGRFGAYLEQSTRYIYFDKRDKNGKFRYFVPQLSEVVRPRYVQTMEAIFEHYSVMVHKLTEYLRKKNPEPSEARDRIPWLNATRAQACDAIRPVLPVATKSTVGIFMSLQAAESLIMHLLSEPLQEASEKGAQILRELRKVAPAFLKRADMPDRGGAITAYRATTRANVRALAEKYLEPGFVNLSEPNVKLLSFWPNSEMELVPEMLFEFAKRLSLKGIKEQVESWNSESKKEKVFDTYMGTRLNRRHRPGRALEDAHFKWEIVGDYGTFRDLQRHRVVDAWEWQQLTPSFGYEIPALVLEAGLEADFRKCFALSGWLYDLLASEGYELEAQYATLLGHQMQYKFTLNLREMFHFLELRTGPAGHPGYRKICNQMFDLVKEVYPKSAAAMRFVNQAEDPALTRLAAERATQFKLEKLKDQS